MRFIRTTNNQIEFIEANDEGKILTSIGLQLGEVYFQIKNHKVSFYLNDSEKPFDNFIWSLNIPLTIDGETYDDEDEVSNVLHNIMNDRFQEQLDQLKEDLAAEEARAQEAEEQLDDKIDDESARAIAAENRLQDQVTELSGAVAVLDNRVTNVENDLSALTDTVNDEITRSTAKDAEHDAQISGLTNTLNSEIQRALAAESGITANLNAEIQNRIADVDAEEARALAAESAITANLNSEISRSTEKDAQHDTQISALTVSLNNEINRATTAENSLRSDLNDEIANRISGDTNLQNQLNAEIARATNAEEDIDDKIDAEIARANSEETRIEGKLDNEITRSTAKDVEHNTQISGLTDDLASEIARATARDNQIDAKLDNEIVRATNAENALDDKIDLEIQNRINAISGLTERVADDEASTGAALVDLNDKINALSGENASQSVQISGLNNSINTEISRATSVENALRSDLTNETSARTNADAAMLERIVAVEVGKADANSVYTKAESDNKYATKDYISGLTDEFQEKLVAGENITIVGNVISATGGGGGVTPTEVQEMIDESISGKANTSDVYNKAQVYTKGETDEAIADAIDDIDLSGYYTKSEVDASQLAQDNKINAISGDVQSLSGKVDTISGDVITLGGNVQSLSGEVQTISGDVQTISGKVDDMKTYVGGRGITIATGETADTISFNLPISAGTGSNSIIEGYKTKTGILASYSHAEGNNTLANGNYSHAEGYSSTTVGDYSHAEGMLTKATGDASHAEGMETEAKSFASHAEGKYTSAATPYSFVCGLNGIASGDSVMLRDTNTIFAIGNGLDDTHKATKIHNALEVKLNGDIYIADTNDTSTTDYYYKPMIKLQDALGQGGGVTSGQVQTMIDNSLVGYQEELTAGTNVQISGGVISATDTKYTAGDGITISNNVISAKIWSGTQAQYDAITTKDSSTIYLIYS